MPGGDGTGPFGTLRNCMPVGAYGNPIAVPFFGRRLYARSGRGFRWRFLETGTPRWMLGQTTQQSKEAELKFLEQQMDAIKKRIEKLKD